MLAVLPDEPLLRLVAYTLIETGPARPVAAKAGGIVKVRAFDELILDQLGHDEAELVRLQVVKEPWGGDRSVVPACPGCSAPRVVGPLAVEYRSMSAVGDVPEY